jgi:hypothetical protein
MTGSSDSTESPGVSKKVENQTLLTGVERAKFPGMSQLNRHCVHNYLHFNSFQTEKAHSTL